MKSICAIEDGFSHVQRPGWARKEGTGLLHLPKAVVVAVALALMMFVGALDYITGRDFAVSAFYLIPICWVGWAVGRNAGIILAVGSTIAWFIADRASGVVYMHPLTPFWNAIMLLAFFLVVVFLLAAFQAAHCRLEETVQIRTAALQAEILERKRLERAKHQSDRLAAVGTMAAQIAHEVRNPLGSITLNLDLIRKEFAKLAGASTFSFDEGHTLVKEMKSEVERIQRVIEEYLQFARLPILQRRPLALNSFLAEKLDFMKEQFEKSNVKLRTCFDPALTTINADGPQLWQALLNLIRNSLEAMPNGGDLTVGTWREGDCVRLRVTDSGKGMSQAEVRDVFAPFFTTKPQGTGLGLTLVQQIATEHGGHVECESGPDKGCTFTLFLPTGETS